MPATELGAGGGRLPSPAVPQGMTLHTFGHRVMRWGTGNEAARARMSTLTREELVRAGVTRDMAEAWSCTSTLRIIRSARESGKLSPFHDQVRGLCHDSTAIFLPTSGLGTPLVVCDAALRLAQPMRGFTTQAIQASAATAQAFQRPEAVSWPHPHAPLCRLCAGPRARTPAARVPATPHGSHARTAAPGRHLPPFLS